MKITVWTRNHVRTTLEQDQVLKQTKHITAGGNWVLVTLKDGRNLQLESPVPGVECDENNTTTKKKKSFLQKIESQDTSA